jgi:TPR repeat protein
MYTHADGVVRDEKKASELFQKSCDVGFGPGCFVLGIRYGFGSGLQQSDVQATAAYKRSCDLGDADGCTSAGRAYLKGRDVPKDVKLGVSLMQQGCDKEQLAACSELAGVSEPEAADAAKKAQGRVFQLAEAGCKKGAPALCYQLGKCYREGKGVTKDEAHAKESFQQACDKNFTAACDELKGSTTKGAAKR